MVKIKSQQSRRAAQALLAEAVREVADAVRFQGEQELRKHRVEIGKHMMELGNLAAGALLFGQAFSSFPFSWRVASLGVVVLVLAYAWAIHLMKGGG